MTGCSEDKAVEGAELMARGEYERALLAYRAAVRADPQDYRSYNAMGTICQQLQDLARAERYLDTCLLLNPRYAFAHMNRGVVKGQLGDSTACFAELDYAIRLDSAYADAYFNRGLNNVIFHRYQRAETDFKQAVKYNRRDFAAYYRLGQLLILRGRVDEGCVYLTRSLALNPSPEAYALRDQYCPQPPDHQAPPEPPAEPAAADQKIY